MAVSVLFALLMGFLFVLVLGAISLGALWHFRVPDTPVGQTFQRAMHIANVGMMCFVLLPIVTVAVHVPQARLVLGALADGCFVWTAAYLDEFHWLIANGPDSPRRARTTWVRRWLTVGLTVLVAVLVLAAWQHGETEDAARLYLVPFANPFSLLYRVLCQLYVGVCMARSIGYGTHFRQISQDPISQLSVRFMTTGSGLCLVALILGFTTLVTPSTALVATPILVLDRLCVVGFITLMLMGNRAFSSHIWTWQAYWRLAALEKVLAAPTAGAWWTRWQRVLAPLRPKVMRLLLRQRVIAVSDARRRLGVVAALGQPLTLEPRQTSWGDQYATGFAWQATLAQLAGQEADYLGRVLQERNAPPTRFILPDIPQAPRAAIYFQEIVYLKLLRQRLAPLVSRARGVPRYA